MPMDRLQRPLRDVRISLTDHCNFRCPYCMPAAVFGDSYRFLPTETLLTFEEITRLSRLFIALGAQKLRLTGGEPLMRPKVEALIRDLAALEGVQDLALTTNGYLLPTKAEALKAAGLHRLTISLDSMDDGVFQAMNGGRSSLGRVLEGIAAAERAGFAPLKINAVIQKGVNDHTLRDLAQFCKGRGYILRLIEYMDVGNHNGWSLDQVVTAEEMLSLIGGDMGLEPLPANYSGEVALRFGYRDGAGEIGIVASVTKPLCRVCTRLRLSADGSLYTCLFATKGIDPRTPLRAGAADEELSAMISGAWLRRTDRYSEIRAEVNENSPRPQKVEMHKVGG